MKLASTAFLMAVACVVSAQVQVLYAPVRMIADQGITLKGWGSGTIAETDETAFEGTQSIRISSRNYFQGGILTYAKPVDLAPAYSNKSNLLRIAIKAPTAATTSGGGPGGGTSFGGGKRGGVGGAGGEQGGLSSGPGAGPGNPGQGTPQAGTTDAVDMLRVIVTTTDGKKSEAYIPLTTSSSANRGWTTVAVPLQALSGFDRTNKTVKSIAFAPDTTATLYIGELRIIEDTTPIQGEITPSALNLGANQEVRLSAYGAGGASILKYSWDFDESDGIQEDATGSAVTRRFRKPGTYTITLTISDYYGLKTPYTTKIKAVVNG